MPATKPPGKSLPGASLAPDSASLCLFSLYCGFLWQAQLRHVEPIGAWDAWPRWLAASLSPAAAQRADGCLHSVWMLGLCLVQAGLWHPRLSLSVLLFVPAAFTLPRPE